MTLLFANKWKKTWELNLSSAFGLQGHGGTELPKSFLPQASHSLLQHSAMGNIKGQRLETGCVKGCAYVPMYTDFKVNSRALSLWAGEVDSVSMLEDVKCLCTAMHRSIFVLMCYMSVPLCVNLGVRVGIEG